jgi:hypothetical protein
MPEPSTVRITFGFVRGALASEEITVQASSCTTFLQLKHFLIQKHNACDIITQQLKFVCVQTLAVLADDQAAGSVAMPQCDIMVNIIRKTAQSAAAAPAAVHVGATSESFDRKESPGECKLANPANSLAMPPSASPAPEQQKKKTSVTGFFAGLGLDKDHFSGEYQSGMNLSHEQQHQMCSEMRALIHEEATTNETDMSKFLAIHENARKPEDRAIDSMLPVGTLVQLDG